MGWFVAWLLRSAAFVLIRCSAFLIRTPICPAFARGNFAHLCTVCAKGVHHYTGRPVDAEYFPSQVNHADGLMAIVRPPTGKSSGP